MAKVAVIAFAQAKMSRNYRGNEIELLLPVVKEAMAASGLRRDQIEMTAAASSDFLAGQAFAFVRVLDAVGIYPVVEDSHIDMDGAWSLYEAWVRLQTEEIDCALVYALGKTSSGRLNEISPMALDPYYMAPLMPDSTGLAALQARMILDAGKECEEDWAVRAQEARRNGSNNPYSLNFPQSDVAALLQEPYVASPLRPHACPPQTDGAAVAILASERLANQVCARPAWISGIAHGTDTHALGSRDLSRAGVLEKVARAAGALESRAEVAEVHAQYAHEQTLICEALGLADSVRVNPSGGPLVGNPLIATGLIRIGEVAQRVMSGEIRDGIAHASWGPCLQQNLVCVLQGAR